MMSATGWEFTCDVCALSASVAFQCRSWDWSERAAGPRWESVVERAQPLMRVAPQRSRAQMMTCAAVRRGVQVRRANPNMQHVGVLEPAHVPHHYAPGRGLVLTMASSDGMLLACQVCRRVSPGSGRELASNKGVVGEACWHGDVRSASQRPAAKHHGPAVSVGQEGVAKPERLRKYMTSRLAFPRVQSMVVQAIIINQDVALPQGSTDFGHVLNRTATTTALEPTTALYPHPCPSPLAWNGSLALLQVPLQRWHRLGGCTTAVTFLQAVHPASAHHMTRARSLQPVHDNAPVIASAVSWQRSCQS